MDYEIYQDIDGQELIIRYDLSSTRRTYFNSKKQIHRLDGPAVEWINLNYCKYYEEGQMHRIGGPAYINSYIFDWYINNKNVKIYYIYG